MQKNREGDKFENENMFGIYENEECGTVWDYVETKQRKHASPIICADHFHMNTNFDQSVCGMTDIRRINIKANWQRVKN